MSHAHATDTQNSDHGNLSAAIHMQVPDQYHRKESNSEVGYSGAGTIQVRDAHEDVFIDTHAMSVRLRAVPEIVDWGALEYGEEEEEEANDGGQGHSGVEDVGVDARVGDSQKGDDDGEFGHDAG